MKRIYIRPESTVQNMASILMITASQVQTVNPDGGQTGGEGGTPDPGGNWNDPNTPPEAKPNVGFDAWSSWDDDWI